MASRKNGIIFNPRALGDFLLVWLVLGTLISLHSRTIDNVLSLLWLAFLCVGSIILLWRRWKHPAEFKRLGMGQLAVLPQSWRNWLLDGSDNRSH